MLLVNAKRNPDELGVIRVVVVVFENGWRRDLALTLWTVTASSVTADDGHAPHGNTERSLTDVTNDGFLGKPLESGLVVDGPDFA